MKKVIKENIVILFDGDECPDGFGGAWVAWKKFKNTAKYIGVLHNEPLPGGLENKTIYLIDFTCSEREMKKLVNDNMKVVLIDHHISAEGATKVADERLFSLKHSGSVLAWKYFNPSKSGSVVRSKKTSSLPLIFNALSIVMFTVTLPT